MPPSCREYKTENSKKKKKRNANVLAAKTDRMSQSACSRSLCIDTRGRMKVTGKVEQ